MRIARGMTLVETLLVISIVSLLISLLMPAVQAARESARKSTCQNHLRQIAIGIQQHELSQKYFPSSGWGWRWAPDADRGFGIDQPGGWAYNTLPYLEQQTVHDLGKGASDSGEKHQALKQMVATVQPLFICPTRRPAIAYPLESNVLHFGVFDQGSARTDYAINRGDYYIFGGPGPESYGDTSYEWRDLRQLTGISFLRSLVRARDVTDGLSKTYLAGEKNMSWHHYADGLEDGDDSSLYHGDDLDTARHTAWSGEAEADSLLPLADGDHANTLAFGSAHQQVWNMAFCDGSVHALTFEIDGAVHRRLGNRKDGKTAELPQDF